MWSVPARHSDACITQTSKLVISHTVPVKSHRGEPGHTYGTHTGHAGAQRHIKGTRITPTINGPSTSQPSRLTNTHNSTQAKFSFRHPRTPDRRTQRWNFNTPRGPLDSPWTHPDSRFVHRQSFHFDTRSQAKFSFRHPRTPDRRTHR